MNLEFLKKLWDYIDKLPSVVKTIVIVLLLGLVTTQYTNYVSKQSLGAYYEYCQKRQDQSEKYTYKMAPEIKRCLKTIAKKDTAAYDVILLNYHNNTKSWQEFEYLYLNCLTDCPSKEMDVDIKLIWHDLDYIDYAEEISAIHTQEFLHMNCIDEYKTRFPLLYKKLKTSGACSAAFYVIDGVEKPVGMLLLLYRKTRNYKASYYPADIVPYIQRLSTILDYANVKENLDD